MTRTFSRRAALATLLAAISAAPALAADAPAADPHDAADIRRVEAYLNALRTLRAQFIQTTSAGGFAEGKLYIERPGKMRLDYAPPAKIQVYSTGFWLIYVDYELQNVSQVPLSSTPAAVLVADEVKLSGDIAVSKLERGPQMMRVHLVQTKEPDAGRLVLAFSDAPLQLRHWTVIDAQGVETKVALLNPEINVPVDRQVFFFDPPPWAGAPQPRE